MKNYKRRNRFVTKVTERPSSARRLVTNSIDFRSSSATSKATQKGTCIIEIEDHKGGVCDDGKTSLVLTL